MRYLVGFICVLALGAMGCSETGGTGGTGGDASCGAYCDKSDECYRIDRDGCMERCADESAREAAISQECANAATAQRACVGDLSCEEVAAWGYRYPPDSFPCLTEFSAVEARCESACRDDDDCDDGRECSVDRCIEDSCYHGLADCPCEAPLSDYCTGSDCQTWDDAVADLSESCDPYRRADAGRCGDFRYIETYWGLDAATRYFDASGALVARVGCTDCNCIECGPGHDAFCIHYGPVPDCALQLEEILCEEPWIAEQATHPLRPTLPTTLGDARAGRL
ncbi:MAG: hypothetical protein ACERNK_05155 [Deltaproteobacteria bacterium]